MAISQDIKRERGKRVRIVRSMAALSIIEFAKAVGVSDKTIKGWEKGKAGGLTEKGSESISNTAKKLNVQCSPIWLMHGMNAQPILTDSIYNKPSFIEPPTKNNKVKKLNNIIKKEIACFYENNMNAAIFQIQDDSMEPYFLLGDIVGGKRKHSTEIITTINKDCIIETVDHVILCRRVHQGSKPNLYTLSCMNPQTTVHPIIMTDQELVSAAPIIWIRHIEW